MARPLLSPYSSFYLKFHQYQGKSNDCGPYCAAIAISALTGFIVSGQQIADEANRNFLGKNPPFIKRIPYSITFPWGMIEILREYNCHARWFMVYSEKELLNRILEPLVVIIIYGQWLPWWGHYAVLTAYHEKLGYGVINPAHPLASVEWIPRQRFLCQWNSFGRMGILVQ